MVFFGYSTSSGHRGVGGVAARPYCPVLINDVPPSLLLRERQKDFAISDVATRRQHLLIRHDRDDAPMLIHKDKCCMFAVPSISALQKKGAGGGGAPVVLVYVTLIFLGKDVHL